MIQAAESPVETTAELKPRFAAWGNDVTPYIARIEALEAELAAMKGGMIQRVGQRFVNGAGAVVTIVDRWNIDIPSRWEGRKPSGDSHFYSDSGKSNIADRWPEESLVGPAPDELVARDLKELDAKYRQLERLHVLPLSEEVRDLPDLIDDGTKDVCHELFVRVQAEMKTTVAGRRFYVRIGLRGCEYLPLRTEGCLGGKAFKATYLPGFSSRGEGIVAVYEVETWRA